MRTRLGVSPANDPWTGVQVRIDLASKQVVAPAGFPLAGFTVDGYRVVWIRTSVAS